VAKKPKVELKLKIGDVIQARRISGTYRGLFTPYTVVGITTRSYVLLATTLAEDFIKNHGCSVCPTYDLDHWQVKFNCFKVPFDFKGWELTWGKNRPELVKWAFEHRYKISQAPGHSTDEQLILIAAMAMQHDSLDTLPFNVQESIVEAGTWEKIKSVLNN